MVTPPRASTVRQSRTSERVYQLIYKLKITYYIGSRMSRKKYLYYVNFNYYNTFFVFFRHFFKIPFLQK